MTPTVQRVVGALVLLVAGMLSLPLAAAVLDGERTDNWVLPAQLVAMAAIGAALTTALPALAGDAGSPATGRRVLVGAGWGLLAAVLGVLVSWLLLNGFRGA
jgi:hypothetical protein